jgi:WD40 repeat protein
MTLGSVILLLCGLLAAGAGLAASRSGKPTPDAPPSVTPSPRNQPPRTDLYGDPLPPGALVRLGSTSMRHGSTVFAVALSPDGRTVASAGGDGRVCLWATADGKLLRAWRPAVTVSDIAFAPDGKTLATGGEGGVVTLWEIPTGKQLRRLTGHAERITALVYSSDGSALASASADGLIRLWRPDTGQEFRQIQGHDVPPAIVKGLKNPGRQIPLVNCLAFAPDGKTLASGGGDETARLWDVATGRQVGLFKGHKQNANRPGFIPIGCMISGVAFSTDGKTLATASYDDNDALLWDVATGKECARLRGHKGGVHVIAFSPAGKTVVTGGAFYDGSVRVWDAATGKQLAQAPGHTHGVYDLAVSKDGRLLASGGADGAVRLWDAASGRETHPWRGHREQVSDVAYAPDGKTLASASHDGTVRLWEAATGKEIRRLDADAGWVYAVAFSPDGKQLASGGMEGRNSIRLWDPVSGREIRPVALPFSARALAFAPDGRRLAVRDNNFTVHLLDTATDKAVRLGTLPQGSTSCVAFSPDGKYVAAASGYGHVTVHLFDAATGKEVCRLAGAVGDEMHGGSVVFSPDGKTLAVGGWDGRLRLWEVASGRERGRLQQDGGSRVAFSPDGRLLALGGGMDSTVRVVDVFTLAERGRFDGHTGRVEAVAFAPDGKTLASGGGDTTVLVWGLSAVKAVRAELSADAAAGLWAELAEADAVRAYRAVGRLAAAPGQATALLRRHVEEAVKLDPVQAKLLADLDSKRLAVRDRAARELEKLGAKAEAALGKALAGDLSLETRQRLERLLQKLEGPALAPETLRWLRAVEALEHIGTTEARAALQRLADGSPLSRLGREARASLERLGKRRTML